MNTASRLDIFLSHSLYTNPVDIKKLKFIFSAIERYLNQNHKEFRELNILEVACGMGGITLPLASLDCKVRAFDIDEKAVSYMQSHLSQNKIQNLTVTIDDGYTFNDGKRYDLVVASEVLQLLSEPLRFIENIKKLVPKGAYLIITIPNGYGPWELKNQISPLTRLKKWTWLRSLFGKSPYIPERGTYGVQLYTKNKIVRMLSELSFRQIDFTKSDSLLTMIQPLRSSPFWGNIDIKLADILPYWLASGWFFLFELEEGSHI